MKKTILLFLFITFSSIFLLGQKPEETEILLSKKNTTPPPYSVRTMSEWEESQALAVTWNGHHALLAEIIRHAITEVHVIIITPNEAQTKDFLEAANIPLDHISFLERPSNSIWIRDYGPWSVYANDVEDLILVDWEYNRPRPDDNVIPNEIATEFNWPIYEAVAAPTDWIHAGGNHLEDGLNTAFSSDLVQLENPSKTEAEIDDVAFDFLGTQRYFKLPRLPYDKIHHLDMHMRLIDEETLLIGEYPPGVADGPYIEQNIEYIKSKLTTPFGNPYTIIRIPMPPDDFGHYPDIQGGAYRTYTNSLIINKSVLVPTYEEQYDSTALRIYHELFPGYNILGINCNSIIFQTGAIHCITKLIGAEDPLLIAPSKIKDTYQTTGSYPIQAIIKHKSGILSATLFYRIKGTNTFNSRPMYNTNTSRGLYQTAIPAFAAGTTIEYYIQAISISGKTQLRPMVAPNGLFSFSIKTAQSLPKARIYQNNKIICDQSFVQYTGSYAQNARSYSWRFEGGEPVTSSEVNPVVYYEEAGNYPVQLIVSNDLGADTLFITDAIRTQEYSEPFLENFEPSTPLEWTILNPDDDSNHWKNTVINSCGADNHALKMNNFNGHNFAYQRDYLSAGINLERYRNTQLVFDLAYAKRTAEQDEPDEMRVNIITCDGDKTTIYDKSGSSLATIPAPTNNFIPNNCDQWRHEQLDLSAYDGTPISIEFENISGKGNNLYLDNIEIKGDRIPNKLPNVILTTPKKDMTIYTNELPYEFNINATASDIDGTVEHLQFLINSEIQYSFEDKPYHALHQFEQYGTYKIQALAQDNEGGIKYSASRTISIQADKIPLETSLDIYPIPASETLNLHLNSSKDNLLNFSLWTLDGSNIQTGEWKIKAGKNTKNLPLRQLPSGIYYLTVNTPQWTIIKKVVVVK